METHKNMTNLEVAKLLRAVAAAYQVHTPPLPNTRFRVVAYERAADSIEHLTSEIKDLWQDGKLGEVPGIGSGLQASLEELFTHGKVKHFEEVMGHLPPAMFELLQVPGIGPKSAYRLSRELGITKAQGALGKLQKAARQGQIRDIEGFGEQSELQILETTKLVKNKSTRHLLPYATIVAEEIIAWMKKSPEVERVEPLGSLRRQVSTIGDVDLSVASKRPEKVIKHFVDYPKKTKLIEAGERTASILVPGGLHVDLMVQPTEAYGALLQHFTGSKEHNIALRTLSQKKGISLSEYGIKKGDKAQTFQKEEDFYRALGMDWIPPEIREDRGEIQAALTGKLPKLVELKDIKGDLHLHSNFPPETSHDAGLNSPEEMAEEAGRLGYEYIALTEHNPKREEKESVILDVLKRKKEKIEKINYSCEGGREKGLQKVFNSLEVDIRPSGELALPEKAFDLLDFVMVSIHSRFQGSKVEQTKRVLKALEHPSVLIFGHPTGRMLGGREGIDLDWEKIFEVCKEKNILLEINSWPERLDLPDTLAHDAIKHGLKLVINTDSHAKDQMELMRYGVSVARRGWAEKSDIANTLGYNEFVSLIKK